MPHFHTARYCIWIETFLDRSSLVSLCLLHINSNCSALACVGFLKQSIHPRETEWVALQQTAGKPFIFLENASGNFRQEVVVGKNPLQILQANNSMWQRLDAVV